MYKDLPSTNIVLLSNANKIANAVICLPIYADLKINNINKICKIIQL